MATYANASGTSTWYKYANEDLAYWNHDNRNLLEILWDEYIVRLKERERHAFAGMAFSIV